MLFRPQSLYLLLAMLCTGAMYLFPINSYVQTKAEESRAYEMNVSGFSNSEGVAVADVEPLLPLKIVVPVLIAVLLITMFLFKNRKRQSTIAHSSYLISVLIIAGGILANQSFFAYLSEGATVSSGMGISFYLPFAVIAFTFLAIRAIKKDEDLVRSLDRLR